jgi:hypothetical protein
MTLWRRASREVYRVYGEDEYLGEDASSGGDESWSPSAGEQSDPRSAHAHEDDRHIGIASPPHGSRPGRLVGLGLLVGVVVGAFGLVALNASHRPPVAPRAGIAQSARASSTSHSSTVSPQSTEASTDRESVAHSSTAPVSPACQSVRTPMHSLPCRWSRAARAAGSAQSLASVKPWQTEISPSEHSEPDTVLPPVGGEFDFER